MDYLKNFTGSGSGSGDPQQQQQQQPEKTQESSGIMDSVNNALGGGKKSEAKEDYLDKTIDFAQEKVLGQGPQDNESAIEQAKDEQISDFIRGQYKGATGKELPIADK